MPTRKTGPKRPAAEPATSGDVARPKGGRPANKSREALRLQDEAIASTVTTLWGFGIPRRDACKAVAAAAAELWAARELTADGVEAIHERCSDAYGSGRPPMLGRVSVDWRRDRAARAGIADMPPVELAALLLVRQGRLPELTLPDGGGVHGGDAPLTAGAQREYLRNRIKIKNG